MVRIETLLIVFAYFLVVFLITLFELYPEIFHVFCALIPGCGPSVIWSRHGNRIWQRDLGHHDADNAAIQVYSESVTSCIASLPNVVEVIPRIQPAVTHQAGPETMIEIRADFDSEIISLAATIQSEGVLSAEPRAIVNPEPAVVTPGLQPDNVVARNAATGHCPASHVNCAPLHNNCCGDGQDCCGLGCCREGSHCVDRERGQCCPQESVLCGAKCIRGACCPGGLACPNEGETCCGVGSGGGGDRLDDGAKRHREIRCCQKGEYCHAGQECREVPPEEGGGGVVLVAGWGGLFVVALAAML